jgi:Uma2 family endonuclease
MSAVAPRLLTAEEFAQLPEPPDGSKQELVRGEIVVTPPPGFRHGRVQIRVGVLLETWARSRQAGRSTVESGLVTEEGPDTVRGPDVAFWSFDRLPAGQEPIGYPEVAADVCVEVVSPSNTRRGMRTKVREYLTRGVRVVWVVDPEARTVAVYHQPGEGRVLWDDATLTDEEVLPGFSCRVAEFFE